LKNIYWVSLAYLENFPGFAYISSSEKNKSNKHFPFSLIKESKESGLFRAPVFYSTVPLKFDQ
jgi:hypothetical protein